MHPNTGGSHCFKVIQANRLRSDKRRATKAFRGITVQKIVGEDRQSDFLRVPQTVVTIVVGRDRQLMMSEFAVRTWETQRGSGRDYIIFNFSMRAIRLNPAITSNWSRLANILVVIRPCLWLRLVQIEVNSPERGARALPQRRWQRIDRLIKHYYRGTLNRSFHTYTVAVCARFGPCSTTPVRIPSIERDSNCTSV